ncbi:MAG: ATP-binding protein [Caldilineaceae bacterium]
MPLPRQRFSTYLITGCVILIFASTLSAGVPAYWITRNQLERQAWSHVENAQQATHSLLVAEQNRLSDLASLFAERPTLRRLAQAGAVDELELFMAAFQARSKMDLLLFCDATGVRVVGTPLLDRCPAVLPPQYMLIADQPAIVVSQPVANESGRILGIATAGIWLDQAFLDYLAASTGAEQSILTTTGQRIASSMKAPIGTAAFPVSLDGGQDTSNNPVVTAQLHYADQHHYAAYSTLAPSPTLPQFHLEVALPVAELIATENRAFAILVTSTGLVALLGVVLATWYVRRLTRPLAELTQVAERISRGDFVAPIPAVATPSEVATLSTALIRSQASMLRALDERAQAHDWLNNLIQSIVEGVVTFDAKGYVTFLSHGAEALLGWRSDEALGQSVEKLFPITGAEEKSFLSQIPQPGDKRLIDVYTRSGKAISLAVTGARLAPPNAKTAQVALVLRDVTHEEALRNLRSYFLANISHEFKTPLSTLNASLELLLDPKEEYSVEEVREVLQPAHLSLLSLQNLIDNLLQSSSIEAGHFVIRKQPIALRHVIEDALRLVQPLFDRRRQTFTLNAEDHWLDSAAPTHIEADKGRLTQVLVNLLVNASKYSPLGGPIELSISAEDSWLRVAVADRGPGIPPHDRLNLFRRYVRLDIQDNEEYGIGLGLYVVKTTIEAHGGAVGIEDRPDGGSVFWFTLPLGLDEDGRLRTKD